MIRENTHVTKSKRQLSVNAYVLTEISSASRVAFTTICMRWLMQLNELLETDLFNQLSDQEQEVVAGGQLDGNTILSLYKSNGTNNQKFLVDIFTYLANQPGVLYNSFDYAGFFQNLQTSGYLDSSSPGGSKSNVPGAKG